MKQTGRYFIALGCVLCAEILVLDGDVVAAGALSGVQLCLQTVIPSLFCFMVLTGFLINSGLYRLISLPLGPLTKGLFCLPPSMGSVVLLSLTGGYPMGAKSIAGLLEQGRLDGATAQQMLPFCCCAGPSFIITAVGSGMFGSAQAGHPFVPCPALCLHSARRGAGDAGARSAAADALRPPPRPAGIGFHADEPGLCPVGQPGSVGAGADVRLCHPF